MMRKPMLAAAFSLSLVQTALAGGLLDKSAEAEAAFTAGNDLQAIQLMRSALVEAWKAAPIRIEKALFVAERAAGYGIYTPRANSVFGQGETLLIYMEPVGFAWAEQNGLFHSHLVADFNLMTPDGKVLAGQKDFGSFTFTSHAHNTEYMATMTLNLTGAPQASYVLDITLRDKLNQDQSASVQLPFEIK